MSLTKIFAIDISGSTSGSFYYNHVDEIMKSLFTEGDFIIFWNDKFQSISRSEAQYFFSRKYGGGGTYPVAIAEAVQHFNLDTLHSDLILITDGEVSVSDVDASDSFIISPNIRFRRCTCYIIGKWTPVKLSVSCPFSRFCPSSTIHLNNDTNYTLVQPSV
jgi:hypothetical protein